MSDTHDPDQLLIERIRAGEDDAWNELIARFEGRLLAYIESRMKNRAAAEDLIQETFIGFLTSLPNYDSRRSLESYLFSIAAHKLTDLLRREGRRPALPLSPDDNSSWEPRGMGRVASSLARSRERKHLEEETLVPALREQIDHWRRRGQWEKLKVAELLFVRGWANKEAAEKINITEQTVANYKFEFLAKLRDAVKSQNPPEEVFPELYEEDDK